MKIANEHIKKQEVVGKSKTGLPVVYVETHGGLHAVFANVNGTIKPLSAMPHRAMAMWLAKRNGEGVQWDQKGIDRVYES